jgi:RNA polymerase sigma factor for flagellar operon FliA
MESLDRKRRPAWRGCERVAKQQTATARKQTSARKRAPARRAKQPESAQEQRQAENAKLWATYAKRRDPQIREQLILQYAPLVKYVMGRLALSLPAILDYEDVLAFGNIGLIESVERFDHSKGVKFETYAIARIRGSIIDALRSLDRLPRSVRQRAKSSDLAQQQLTNDLGRQPTDHEVAQALELDVETYRKHLVNASWITVSLDSMHVGGEDDSEPGAFGVADPDAEVADDRLEHHELVGDLAAEVGQLPEREQLILSLYYQDEMTMRNVASVLGISESRVCQLHARALTRLRQGIERRQHGCAA